MNWRGGNSWEDLWGTVTVGRGRLGEGEVSSYGKKYTDSGDSNGGEVVGLRGCTISPHSWFSFPWFQLLVVNHGLETDDPPHVRRSVVT